MRVLLFFFSGTGNTYYVSKMIQERFLKENYECDLYAIEALDDVNNMIIQADLIGVGYPIYGSMMPENVEAFLKALKPIKKQAFVFCTQAMYSGDGANIAKKVLRTKGFDVRWCAHVNMPNNITDYKLLPTKEVKYEKLEKRVKKKLSRFVGAIIRNKRLRKGENVFSLGLGLVQRVPFRKVRDKFKEALKVSGACDLCKLCVRICPTQNFVIEDDKLTMKHTCYLCYRCINHCPKHALHFSKSFVKRPYQGPTKDFNIKDVMRHQLSENKGHK